MNKHPATDSTPPGNDAQPSTDTPLQTVDTSALAPEVQPSDNAAPTDNAATSDSGAASPSSNGGDTPPPHLPSPPQHSDNTILPLVVYILYLLCYFAYLPTIIGVVIAYTARSGSTPLHAAHYRFQIRTFWIALFYSAIVMLTAMTVILFALAILLGSLAVLWVVIRSVRGIVSLQRKEAPHNPNTWLY